MTAIRPVWPCREAVPRFLTLRFPDFALDEEALRSLVNDRTRMIVLNTPMNPTGKVFTHEELEVIASVCREHDLIALTDEVYEHLVFDGAVHKPLASLPGMRERTLTLSSAGKTYSFTGWKIGWGTGPKELVDGAQAAHQFLTYAIPTPLQEAIAYALTNFREDFLARIPDRVPGPKGLPGLDAGEAVGFDVATPRAPTSSWLTSHPFSRGTTGNSPDGSPWSMAWRLYLPAPSTWRRRTRGAA